MTDCPPRSISTLPATTLECSDANASGVFVLSFQSLKNDTDTGESFSPRGSHCHLRHECSGSHSQQGVIKQKRNKMKLEATPIVLILLHEVVAYAGV